MKCLQIFRKYQVDDIAHRNGTDWLTWTEIIQLGNKFHVCSEPVESNEGFLSHIFKTHFNIIYVYISFVSIYS